MAQTKIYPATKQQAENIQDTVDEINAKIVTPNYQDKTVTPSDVQQIVQADNGYNALHSVTVEPIAAAMPENLEAFVLKKTDAPFSLYLDGAVPEYACYKQGALVSVYGSIISVGTYAFSGCSNLQSIDLSNANEIGERAFEKCSDLTGNIILKNVSPTNKIAGLAFPNCKKIESVDMRNYKGWTNYNNNSFLNCSNLKYIDLRSVTDLMGSNIFSGCPIEFIDLTLCPSPPPLHTDTFNNITNNSWMAIVKDDNKKSEFQSATNWSTYASHFRTIAEVEQETGMSYDDYYYQCFGHARN